MTLNGLTTSSTNEFAEVILGGTIAIPVAVAFFGLAETQAHRQRGRLRPRASGPAGHLPEAAARADLRRACGSCLLFIAGITSSVALAQPAVAFLEDEFGWSAARRGQRRLRRAGGRATLLVVALLQVRLPGRAGLLGRHLRPGRLRHHRDHHVRLGLRHRQGWDEHAQGRRPAGAARSSSSSSSTSPPSTSWRCWWPGPGRRPSACS